MSGSRPAPLAGVCVIESSIARSGRHHDLPRRSRRGHDQGRPGPGRLFPGDDLTDHRKRLVDALASEPRQEIHDAQDGVVMILCSERAIWKNFPVAPVDTRENVMDDSQLQDRFTMFPHEERRADMLSLTVCLQGEELPAPATSLDIGVHRNPVRADGLGYDASKFAELKEKGVFGN